MSNQRRIPPIAIFGLFGVLFFIGLIAYTAAEKAGWTGGVISHNEISSQEEMNRIYKEALGMDTKAKASDTKQEK